MFGFVQICSQQQDATDNEEEDSISFPPLESHQESERKNLHIPCVLHILKKLWTGLDQLAPKRI